MTEPTEAPHSPGSPPLQQSELLNHLLHAVSGEEALLRVYLMTGEISRAIIRSRTRGELFSAVCRIVVDIGGFGCAWLGTVRPDGRLAEEANCCTPGFEGTSSLVEQLWTDAQSHAGTESAASVIFLTPGPNPAHGEQGREPARTGALLLLWSEGRTTAALALFSDTPAFSDAAARGLLEGIAADLGRALERFEHDIARQRAEALSESEQRFGEMLARANLVAITLDLDGRVTFCNEFAATLLGWSRSEMTGKDWFAAFLPVETRESLRLLFLQNIRAGTIGAHQLNDVLTRDGRRRAISWSYSVLYDASGNTLGAACIGEDITERRNAEQALRESEERYRLLFSANPLPMWVVDAETLSFLDANDAAVRHYGFSREEFLAMHATDIRQPEEGIPPEPYPPAAEGRPGRRIVHHRKKNGVILTVELDSFEIMYGKRRARLVVAHDVTEVKQLEEQVRQWQKMEAIGRLAGGVAHDFNNLLMAIKGYTELTLADLGPDDPHRPDLEEVHKAAQRGADLTRQLLAFGRRQILKPEILDLNSVVLDMNRILLRTLGADVELSTHLDPHLYRVRADRGQIGQVLLNLVVNARDAMPHGGKLTIETCNAQLDEEFARTLSGVKPGSYAVLSVTDTGTGIPPHVMAHLFEPFFTTKDKDKGSGLGLSTVYGIVRQSGGHVWVNSDVGVGTTFRVYLPQAPSPPRTIRDPGKQP